MWHTLDAPSARRIVELLALTALGAALSAGCRRSPSAVPDPGAGGALFRDVAAQSGVRFTHSNGSTGRFYFIESTPAGCAFLDFDRDGLLDILLVQSGPSDPRVARGARPHCGLFRNRGGGAFTDATAGSGLDRDLGYGQGVAVGDYDNDGYEDLFFTSFGGNHLFHNEGGTGRFAEVTERLGLGRIHSTGYATSAAFGDYDNDGRLDLYVCYYCPWTWARDRPCNNARQRRDYCAPEVYDPEVHRLYRNERTRFRDASQHAGIARARGRGLAVAFVDYDEDGRQDIFVANDLSPNMLWRNRGDGTFAEVAAEAGCAYSEGGVPMAGMGVAVGDYDHSGRESLFVTNFSGLPNTLFRNTGRGLFEDVSTAAGVALPHMRFLAFGCEFLDYDRDGWQDLVVANGHVSLQPDTTLAGVTYAERKQLFHNEGKGIFREIAEPRLLGGMMKAAVSRGLAVGDVDNDGRLDVLVNSQNNPAELYRNLDPSPHHWISFRCAGVRSNRDGLHARVTIVAGGVRQTATVRAGSSYLSRSDPRVFFGLGETRVVDRLEVVWPSGIRDRAEDIAADKFYLITEGKVVTHLSPR